MTDTFGGEPNYSWVKRYWTRKPLTERQAIRAAKKAFDMAGVRCSKDLCDDGFTLKPSGACIVVFGVLTPLNEGVGVEIR
jgi:hypothetical protein